MLVRITDRAEAAGIDQLKAIQQTIDSAEKISLANLLGYRLSRR